MNAGKYVDFVKISRKSLMETREGQKLLSNAGVKILLKDLVGIVIYNREIYSDVSEFIDFFNISETTEYVFGTGDDIMIKTPYVLRDSYANVEIGGIAFPSKMEAINFFEVRKEDLDAIEEPLVFKQKIREAVNGKFVWDRMYRVYGYTYESFSDMFTCICLKAGIYSALAYDRMYNNKVLDTTPEELRLNRIGSVREFMVRNKISVAELSRAINVGHASRTLCQILVNLESKKLQKNKIKSTSNGVMLSFGNNGSSTLSKEAKCLVESTLLKNEIFDRVGYFKILNEMEFLSLIDMGYSPREALDICKRRM